MPHTPPDPEFDLFVSYAHRDDPGKVAVLVEAIKADYRAMTGADLKVFFDTGEIRTGDDWMLRIRKGLRNSKILVAVLSENYFQSAFCRLEWENYVEVELALALPGEGIHPIYIVSCPGFDAKEVEPTLRRWVSDLKRRQYIDWLPFWPDGAKALERADARRRLDALPGQIADRLTKAAERAASPNTVHVPGIHFVGRRDEMHAVREALVKGQVGVITAVHGIPGIGKSMLAFAYAWGYGYEYPGGRFLIDAADRHDLTAGVVALAVPRGLALTDDQRNNPAVALAMVKRAFETGPRALIVIDNLDEPALLTPQARAASLPQGDHVHVLVTSRRALDDVHGVMSLPLDALAADDALALLQRFRPVDDTPQDDEWKAALDVVHRLGGHALAVEVVAVYLRENPRVTYREFADTLERDGIIVMEEDAGPEAQGRLAWHTQTSVARLLEPTLSKLAPEESRAVALAALLPADAVPLPWLRALLLAEFPGLARQRSKDPLDSLFTRLARLRLIVPQVSTRTTVEAAEATGDARLGRMHRLVQDVVRARLGAAEATRLEAVIDQYANDRADWMKSHWGALDLDWELRPLRDVATRLIDRGERRGYLIGDKIATPLFHTGRMLDVRDLWRRSADLFGRLSSAAPGNADYARDLSVSYNKLGDLARAAGDPETARDYYERDLAIARRLSAAAPGNADYARDLSVSYERLGDLARAAGDPESARKYYLDSEVIWRRLSDAAPGNADYARGLTVPLNRLGDLAVAAGDPESARGHYEGGLAIARRLSAAAPGNADYARDLSISYERLGDLARAAGDPESARKFYLDSEVIWRRLSDAAPGNADYARGLTVPLNRLGDLARAAGDPESARGHYEVGLAIARRLSAAAPGNADYARDLSVSYNKLGDLARAAGDPESARGHYEGGLAIARRLSAAAPGNADYARDLSVSYERLGDLAVAAGDPESARGHYEGGLAIRARLSAAAPGNADYARDLCVSYWKMAVLAERASAGDDALAWWRRAYDVLNGLRNSGRFVSPGDQKYLRNLEEKLGLK